MIHILYRGMPLCGFTVEAPVNWPVGETWLSLMEQLDRGLAFLDDVRMWPDGANCKGCLRALELHRVIEYPGGHVTLVLKTG